MKYQEEAYDSGSHLGMEGAEHVALRAEAHAQDHEGSRREHREKREDRGEQQPRPRTGERGSRSRGNRLVWRPRSGALRRKSSHGGHAEKISV